MKAVIMAGGQGSRLRPLTEGIPKPMIPILGRPMMEYILEAVRDAGITDILVTLHYRPNLIQDYFGDGSDWGVNIDYAIEENPLGTAGSVKNGAHFLDDTFLIISGDALMDYDLGALMDYHARSEALVTFCLARVQDPSEFGIVVTGDDGRVQRFQEKPGPSEVFTDTVNTGIYVMDPRVLEDVPADTEFDFSHDLFPALLDRGEPLMGYVAKGYWNDIGNVDQLAQSTWDLLEGLVDLPIPGEEIRSKVYVEGTAHVEDGCSLQGPAWIGRDAILRSGAVVGPYAVVGRHSEVDAGARVRRSIVLDSSYVGEHAEIRGSFCGNRVLLEQEVEVEQGAVLADDVHLGRRVSIEADVRVWPHLEVEADTLIDQNVVWESVGRPALFSEYGVAGLANLRLTPETAARIGKAFGSWLGRSQRVVVGHGSHAFSHVLEKAFVSGLLSVGIEVEALGVSAHAITRFAVARNIEFEGGAFVRQGPEHAQVAVIELYDRNGHPLPRKGRRKVEATYRRADFPKVDADHVGRLLSTGDHEARYVSELMAKLDRKALVDMEPKLAVLSRNRWSTRVLDILLDEIQTEAVTVSGETGPHGRDTEDPGQRLREIYALGGEHRRIGLYLSADGRSMWLLDEYGHLYRPQTANHLLTLAYLLDGPARDGETGQVFLPPQAPDRIRDLAGAQGFEIAERRLGLAETITENQSSHAHSWLDFEHFYLGMAAVPAFFRLLDFLARHGTDLADLAAYLSDSHTGTIDVECPWRDMGWVMRHLTEEYAEHLEGVSDGVKVRHPEGGWTYVVPASGEPVLRVFVEGDNEAEVQERLERIRRNLVRMIRQAG
ncbi:sugar phosphate nucleotidyltransferase [Thiohalorhabdus methylotrophus]|uniref:Sugar phosphate nucleotidyltransferase n=1 Tax=Thiohalorhabdus methylotrophus TaxID=3242694 RepID=A0ABV4TPS8_9GAMM